MSFVATWMDPEIVRLTESQVRMRKTNTLWYYMQNLKKKKRYKWTCLQNRNRVTEFEIKLMVQFISVQSLSRVQLFETPWPVARQASLSITNSWRLPRLGPSRQWCYPAISSSVVPFSSCPQSLPASESFPMSHLFTSGGQNIRASTSFIPMNIQGWFPLLLISLISLLFKGLSRIFSSTTIWRHHFFSTQPSLWSNSHIHIWLLGKP